MVQFHSNGVLGGGMHFVCDSDHPPMQVWLAGPGTLVRDFSVQGSSMLPQGPIAWNSDAHTLALYVRGRARIRRVIGHREDSFDIAPGDFTLHPPQLPSRWDWDSPFDVLHVHISPAFLAQIAIDELGPGTTVALQPSLPAIDEALVKLGMELMTELAPPHPMAFARGVRTIGERIAIHLLRHYAVVRTVRPSSRRFETVEIESLQSFMADHIEDDVRVAEMARIVGLSEHHFFRVFRETFGKTPRDYFQEQRLEHARDLLATTSMSIAEIAVSTGFADQSHLARCFKRRFNAAPSRFRSGAREAMTACVSVNRN